MMNKKVLIYAKNFVLCGLIGWCLECNWTGLGSLLKKDRELTCHTSYWMFPIYGVATFIQPIHQRLKKQCFLIRGLIYTALIYCVEFISGTILTRFHACPWNYSKHKHNYKGIILLDYLPAWFFAGLFYEKILSISTKYFSMK